MVQPITLGECVQIPHMDHTAHSPHPKTISCMRWKAQSIMIELHEIDTDRPGWDTKQHCTCGYESASKCEQWKHASDELRKHLVRVMESLRLP